jgi:hypothetical protein
MNSTPERHQFTRRQFLIAGAGAAGSLVIGLPALAFEEEGERKIGFFVQAVRSRKSDRACVPPCR